MLAEYKPLIGAGEVKGSEVEALQLNKWVRKKLNILQDVSLTFKPGEFIVVVGASGGGKTTLVDAIAGYRPATHGRVFVDGIDVYRNVDSMRGKVGYVPQRDIIHMELTVYQALEFSARLRLPPHTTRAERKERIHEVLEELGLENHQDMRISELSGGQQKRVSIGVELLTRPGLFFLDEPTSGLDPGNETAFMYLMRRLADQGRTVVMISHTTKNVMLADKVLFMGRGGYMAWFGPPAEAMTYFAQFRTKRQFGDGEMQFDEIYAILDDPELGDAKDWADRFQESQAYRQYVLEPLQPRQELLEKEKTRARLSRRSAETRQYQEDRKRARKNRISGLRQFIILSVRNLTILGRDRSSLILMLLIAPIVGTLDLFLAPLLGKNVFSYENGSAVNASVIFYLWSIYSLLVGGLSQMREFVKEASIYKRERLVNLRIFPYVASKVWVALILALYHALAFTLIRYLAFNMPGGLSEFIQVYVTLLLGTITGMMIGLMASAISNNQSTTPLIMILLTVPMYMFSGALAPIPEYLSVWASTRWSYEALMGIAGIGSDVSRDPCWQLPADLRDGMSLDDKEFFQCNCMGLDMFSKDSCDFPGVGAYYTSELNQDPPASPAALPDAPPEPLFPDPPDPPADVSNQVVVVQYLDALKKYQEDVTDIQDDYRNQVDIYQTMAEIYQNDMIQYQEDLAKYTVRRVSAVSGAEGVIDSVVDRWSWAFVNKRDPKAYLPWLYQVWAAQVILMLLYFVVILILIKRKDSQ
ncbi:MAG: ABC transporter ATP-binding protein [Anaerolineales bacterium]|nr:MAG: ABC transporter ATP-binding protein [Anaerolineales bacterium]